MLCKTKTGQLDNGNWTVDRPVAYGRMRALVAHTAGGHVHGHVSESARTDKIDIPPIIAADFAITSDECAGLSEGAHCTHKHACHGNTTEGDTTTITHTRSTRIPLASERINTLRWGGWGAQPYLEN